MGTHLRVLSESYRMNTNMAGFKWFSKKLSTLTSALDKSSLRIGWVNPFTFRTCILLNIFVNVSHILGMYVQSQIYIIILCLFEQ